HGPADADVAPGDGGGAIEERLARRRERVRGRAPAAAWRPEQALHLDDLARRVTSAGPRHHDADPIRGGYRPSGGGDRRAVVCFGGVRASYENAVVAASARVASEAKMIMTAIMTAISGDPRSSPRRRARIPRHNAPMSFI